VNAMSRYQGGLSTLGWLVVLMVIGVVAMLTVRLAPHYIDFQTIVSIVDGLPKESVHTMSKTEIRDTMLKRMKINNIRDLDARSIIEIDRKRDGTTLIVHYERRESLVYNVDLLLTFDRRFSFQ
jgi:hypothetical protein